MPYAYYPARQGRGELVFHNGYWSLDIEPATFYNSSLDPKSAQILKNEFTPNTQYIFDMWIEADNAVSGGANRPEGLIIYYTDGTYGYCCVTGNNSNPLGYQHIVVKTNASKSVSYVNTYYYTSWPTYYRIDSVIVPASDPNISKQGIITSNNFTETLSGVNKQPGIQRGNIFAEQFYEI